MPFFELSGKATRNGAMPGEDGSDKERAELERKHTDLIYRALQKVMRKVAPAGTTVDNITPDDAVRRYREHESILRDAMVAMLTDGAMLGADVGRAQTDWLMGVGKAATVVGVDWDLINEDVLSWVMGGGALGGTQFGQGYADAVTAAMATTSERQLRTLIGEWIRNDLTYRQLVDDLSRTVFSRQRAEMIVTTETSRSFFEGNRAAWRRSGIISRMMWRTAADEIAGRCSICGPRNGEITDVNGDFSGGYTIPAHPRCRCFASPVADEPTMVQPTDVTSVPEAPIAQEQASANVTDVQTAEQVRQRLSEVEKQYAARIQKVEELRLRYETSADEIGRLTRRQDEILAEYYNATPARQKELDKESRAIRKELKSLRKLRDEWTNDIHPTYVERANDARQFVQVENPANNKLRLTSIRVPEETAKHFRKGLNEFNKLVSADVWSGNTIPFNQIESGQRAYYSPGTGYLNVSATSRTRIIVHEIAHKLETEGGLYDKVREFYDRRTAGEALGLIRQQVLDETGEYLLGMSDSEVGRRDKWIHPYIGRDYSYMGTTYNPAQSTEVLSMGMQYMYEDPIEFARKDPEMFDFIFNLLRGR